METMVSSQAWDVPRSNMVVNLKKIRKSVWGASSSVYYIAGVSLKQNGTKELGYTMFNEKGEDPYTTMENLMSRISRCADIVFAILDRCDKVKKDGARIVKSVGWEALPPMDDDFGVKCFSSLSRTLYLMDRDGKDFDVCIRRRECDGKVSHYAYIAVGDEIVFKGKPGCLSDVVDSLKMSALAAGMMLEKFQDMAWNVMIDSSDPDYDVEMKMGYRNARLKSTGKAVANAQG